MKCPGCGREMQIFDLHHVKVDRCKNMKCRGFWFDEHELRRVLADQEETLGIFDLDLLADLEKLHGRMSERLGPKGNELVTIVCPDTKVEVDVDPATGGVYLDQGELKAIRSQLGRHLEQMTLPAAFMQLLEESWEVLKAEHPHKREEIREIFLMARFLYERVGVAMNEKHPALMALFRQVGKMS